MFGKVLRWLTLRLLDPKHKVDYLIAVAIGLAPLACAAYLGILDNYPPEGVPASKAGKYWTGYGHSYNFTTMIVFLPVALYLLRRIVGQIAPVLEDKLPETNLPPLIRLVAPEGRASAYADLRQALLEPRVIGGALLTDFVIHLVDTWSYILFFVQAFRGASVVELEKLVMAHQWKNDWSIVFIAKGTPTAGETFVMMILVYFMQFALIFLGVYFFFFAARHNWFFLQQVYQRRWSQGVSTLASRIVINLYDPDKCFGFRLANQAFNWQVRALMALGIFMLGSRIYHVNKSGLDVGTSFAAAGQLMLALGWLAAFAVVSIPALVKSLPRLPIGPELANTTVVTYLREFLPDSIWPVTAQPKPDEVDYFSSLFAANAFWPTGDNRAKQAFLGASMVFLFLLYPVTTPRIMDPLGAWKFPAYAAYLAAFPLIAWIMTYAGLSALRWSLKGIDDRLVNVPATPLPVPARIARLVQSQALGKISHIDLRIEKLAENSYHLELNSLPSGANAVDRGEGTATIDVTDLNVKTEMSAYGAKLGQALFADDRFRDLWVRANTIASGTRLRIRLDLDQAPELHAVRWEALRDANGFELFRGEDRWFSRFLANKNTNAKLAGSTLRSSLKALVVISNPVELESRVGGLEPIPVAQERARAEKFLAGLTGNIEYLDSGGKATMDQIKARLELGVDVLYLICHGSLFNGEPSLLLEKPDGTRDKVNAVDLVRMLQDLGAPPSLIVLASCQSAGAGRTEDALQALGPRLAGDAAVPAVIAMQGKIGMETVAEFMPRFFEELNRDGQIDRAMAVARGEISRKFPNDYWMPVLFMRFRNGMLWRTDDDGIEAGE